MSDPEPTSVYAYAHLDTGAAEARAKAARTRRRTKMSSRRAALRLTAAPAADHTQQQMAGLGLGSGLPLLRRASSSSTRMSTMEKGRIERKVRNRLSAAASRKRKNDKVKNLESRVDDLEKENAVLRLRMQHMEHLAASLSPQQHASSASATSAGTTSLPARPFSALPNGIHVDKPASIVSDFLRYSLLETLNSHGLRAENGRRAAAVSAAVAANAC